jgi:hypothetical protein
MRIISWLVLSSVVLFALSACDKDRQADGDDLYSYLMMHPKELKGEMNTCYKQMARAEKLSDHCKRINVAGQEVMEVFESQQRNPELFGQDVLIMQQQLSSIQQEVKAAAEKVKLLRDQQASSKAINDAESQYAKAVMRQKVLNKNVRVALAVIGLNSPE